MSIYYKLKQIEKYIIKRIMSAHLHSIVIVIGERQFESIIAINTFEELKS